MLNRSNPNLFQRLVVEVAGIAARHAQSYHCLLTYALINNHAIEYVNGNVHTNSMENLWSLLKRGLHGTYIAVEPFHLFRCIDEQAFRNNYRKDMTDSDRFHVAVSQIVGRRLTYAEPTGKIGETPLN